MTNSATSLVLDDNRFDELLVEYLEDAISDEDGAALDAALRGSQTRQWQFTQICLIGQAIAESREETLMNLLTAGLVETAAEPPPDETWRSEAWQWFIQPMTLGMLVSSLVMTIILLSLALWQVPDWRPNLIAEHADVVVVAQITNTHAATWDKSSDGNFKNTELFAGERLVLASGLAEVTFVDGAVVVLEGPTEFQVAGSGAGNLQQGNLAARVPPRASGFRVQTPAGTIVDLGTEFGAWVSPQRQTDVQVFEGSVELLSDATTGGGPPRTVLRAGEAIRVSPDGKVATLSPADRPRIARRIGQPTDQDHALVSLDGRRDPSEQGWQRLGGIDWQREESDGQPILVFDDQSTEDVVACRYTIPLPMAEQAAEHGYTATFLVRTGEQQQANHIEIVLGGRRAFLSLYNHQDAAHASVLNPQGATKGTADGEKQFHEWQLQWNPGSGAKLFVDGQLAADSLELLEARRADSFVGIGGVHVSSQARTGRLELEYFRLEVPSSAASGSIDHE